MFSLAVAFKFQEMYPKGYFNISMMVKINEKTLLVLRNRTYNIIYTQLDSQNTGNSVSAQAAQTYC